MIAFKPNRPHPIGLHIGSRSATLIQLAGAPDALEVHAIAQCDIPFHDKESTDEQNQEAAVALKKLLAEHDFKGKAVVSCLGSQELFVQNVRVPQLPREELEKVVRWEAEERLPYPIEDAEIRHLLAAEVRQDSNVKQEVLLMACHRGVVDRHVRILEQAGLAPMAVDVEPCAILRAFRANNETDSDDNDQRAAYLHLDHKATTVIFAEGDQILFLKFVPNGGHHLDQAVSRHLDLTLEEAATMRSDVTAAESLDTDNEIHRSVIDAIRNPLEAIATEVELCLRYFKVTFRGKPLNRAVLTGCEANPWLAEFFENRLGTTCVLGNPFDCLESQPNAPSIMDRAGRWTTAVGLSLKPN